MPRFQYCVLLFKMAALFPDVYAEEDNRYQNNGKQEQVKTHVRLVLSLFPTP